MEIRFSSPDDLVITGRESELIALKGEVSELRQGTIFRPARTVVSAPYSVALTGLLLSVTDGPTLVEVVDDYVRVSGSPENLDRFASFLNLSDGSHSHFDWFAGNDYVAESSIPLVIECRSEA